jgi:hypothetical protein
MRNSSIGLPSDMGNANGLKEVQSTKEFGENGLGISNDPRL